VLIAAGALPEKQAGTRAIAAGSTHQAINNLENALRVNPNDPEALIYLNNARLGDHKAYTLAVAVPLSHDLDSALEVLRGVARTQDEVNQSGGIGGTPLRVIIADDENRPDLARAIAQTLVNDPDVLGVVGHCGSEAALAAIYQQQQLVAISPLSTSVDLSNAGSYAPGATGTIRFLPSGDRNQGVNLVTIQPSDRSGFGFDFVPTNFNPPPLDPRALGFVPSISPVTAPNGLKDFL